MFTRISSTLVSLASKGSRRRNMKNTSRKSAEKAEAAQRTASLLLPHMVDELSQNRSLQAKSQEGTIREEK